MVYYIEFDIAGIILCLILISHYFIKKHFNDIVNKLYIGLLFTILFTGIFDILSAVSINNHYKPYLVIIFTNLYYLFCQGITYLFLSFVLYQLESDAHMSSIGKHFLRLPIIYYVLIILTNGATGWVFSYSNETGYVTGPLNFLSYAISIFYFVWAFIFVTKRKNIYNKSLRYNVYNISILNFGFIIAQLFVPHHMIVGFGFSVGMVVLAFYSSRRDAIINQHTGMLNRECLSERITKLFYLNDKFETVFVRMADYDQITNVYGIQKTEELVNEIARYLTSLVGIGNAFQTNNSTFVLICDENININSFMRSIHTKLSAQWEIEGQTISFAHLITRVSCPARAKNIDAFLASITYFEKMKRMRYGIVPSEELAIRDRVRETVVERAIKEGLLNGNVSVYYQPICTADDQNFVTAEALVRLNDPELGFVSPAEFIPVAERCGLMIDVGNFVLKEVCRFINENDLAELGISYIEVNLSVVQCLQRDFINFVDEITTQYGVDSDKICFEITETAANCSPEIFTHNLETLSERGYRLALDDFGSGYGNIERMVTSPFNIVKFDKDMTDRVCETERMRKAFEKMVSFVKSIDQKIVSEGVETLEQYEFLKSVGVNYIQGFYFSKPLPEQDYIKFLNDHKKTP